MIVQCTAHWLTENVLGFGNVLLVFPSGTVVLFFAFTVSSKALLCILSGIFLGLLLNCLFAELHLQPILRTLVPFIG